MRLRTLLSTVLCLTLASAVSAQDKKLDVGQAAPGLDIEEWVKGSETTIEGGSVYVVEFWATWCAPCRKAIPHLTKLQDYYGSDELRVIGVSTEEVDTVKKFVKRQGDRMNYTVAVDRRGASERAWTRAAKLDGIPAAFIVDRNGKIQFIGNPHDDDFDLILDLVINGRYDAKMAAESKSQRESIRNARRMKNWRMANRLMDDLIETDTYAFAPMALKKFEMTLVDMNDEAAAYKYAEKLLDQYAGDSWVLGRLARTIATDPVIPDDKRNFDIALSAAKQAAEAGRANADAYAVQALVHFHAGNIDEAVSLQKKAYFKARPQKKAGYKRTLESYQAARAKASLGG
jgi:thiol-disulfide isomerase/thioredoxin